MLNPILGMLETTLICPRLFSFEVSSLIRPTRSCAFTSKRTAKRALSVQRDLERHDWQCSSLFAQLEESRSALEILKFHLNGIFLHTACAAQGASETRQRQLP